ncbi:MAG: hypothetical protein P4N41_18015 [Negativicutes bacterium]|nr:hypothetical protein [Negativicutes bacterium]
MSKPILKISFPAESNMTMNIFKNEHEQLIFEMYPDDLEGSGGGRAEVDSKEFLQLLNKLISE